jgi:ABC-type glycerol-3-phosphate transport system permease component
VSAQPPAPVPAPAQTLTIPPALVTAAAALGPWGLLLVAAVQFGVPFVTHLVGNAANNVPPTPEEWAKLAEKNAKPFEAL